MQDSNTDSKNFTNIGKSVKDYLNTIESYTNYHTRSFFKAVHRLIVKFLLRKSYSYTKAEDDAAAYVDFAKSNFVEEQCMIKSQATKMTRILPYCL